MSEGLDIAALLAGGQLDRETIANLKKADRAAMKKLLSQYLPDEQVDAVLARIDALVRASEGK